MAQEPRRTLARLRFFGSGGTSAPRNFDDLPLSEATLTALRRVFRYETMSEPQIRVLPAMLSTSCDFVVQAHTGTGKTLSFLIPAVEAMTDQKGVSLLVITPTRELAVQVAREAEMLLSEHKQQVVTLIGGTSPRQDQLALRRKKPRVVVATPGRLLEHFERTFLFPTLFESLDHLVLDEADRLLDLGFIDTIKQITAYLPRQRRTALFSATIPESLLDVATKVCRKNYEMVNCVVEEATAPMQQFYAVLPGHQIMTALYNVLMTEMARDRYKYKILVFFATARLTSFMAQFFRQQLRIGVYEIHRRRDMDARMATQARFQSDPSGVLFSSDVSARGMDYPGVTLVVQVGAPAARDNYIHRIGRTARAGKDGQALLLLGDQETGFLRAVEDLPLVPYPNTELQRVNEIVLRATKSWISSAALHASATAAFASLLVHYKATHRVLHMSDDAVIQAAGDLLLGCGLTDQPVITKRLGIMLGLERHPMIKCATRLGEDMEDDDEKSVTSEKRRSWRG